MVNQPSTVFFVVAALGLFVANGISNAMKRLVYARVGKTFRVFSTQLVREYRALYGKDRNYWAYCLCWLGFAVGLLGFAFLQH